MNDVFFEMTSDEMEILSGGGWKEFWYVLGGCLMVGASPFVAYVNPSAGVGVFSTGLTAIGQGCH